MRSFSPFCIPLWTEPNETFPLRQRIFLRESDKAITGIFVILRNWWGQIGFQRLDHPEVRHRGRPRNAASSLSTRATLLPLFVGALASENPHSLSSKLAPKRIWHSIALALTLAMLFRGAQHSTAAGPSEVSSVFLACPLALDLGCERQLIGLKAGVNHNCYNPNIQHWTDFFSCFSRCVWL